VKPSEALRHRRQIILDAIKRHRLSNARVFGSTLRGTDREGSDLDLLVDAAPDVSLLDIVRAQREIEAETGIAVDLLTPDDLPTIYRVRVLAEAVPL
jgi:uncharacterized protein